MLLNLHVKNLALIKEVDVDFSNGLIVLTGETGAGKSLVLGSVNLALGNKASKDIIRNGTDYALVELTFKTKDDIARKIKNLDIYVDDDNLITVTRKIYEGRSIAKVNGETVNLNILKNVMSMLVDIHGQHDHQSLLYENNHLALLDKYIGSTADNLLTNIKDEYSIYKKAENELSEMTGNESNRTREIEFAKYEINEIESANLVSDEDIKVEHDYKNAANAKDTIEHLSVIYNLLEGNNSIISFLENAINHVNMIKNDDIRVNQFKDTLFDLDSISRELCTEISAYNSECDYNPQLVNELEERLNLINHLKLKYGSSIEEIISYKNEKMEFLEKQENYEIEKERLERIIKSSKEKLSNYCEELSLLRKQYAKKLEQEIENALADLNFLDVNFKINFENKDCFNETGMDNVSFMISTNPGEPLKELKKVASGGELSRIMLALKSIIATEDDIEVLIFDEIDTGISGKTAQRVAEKLVKIARSHQVICISHLSQIAAMADEHFLIQKTMEENATFTNIKKLSRVDSIKEIVRINGGEEITQTAIAHATEMKDMADRAKSNLI